MIDRCARQAGTSGLPSATSIEPSDAIRIVEIARVHGIRAFSLQARSDTTMSPVGFDTPDEILPHVFAWSRKEPPLDVPKLTMTSSDEAFMPTEVVSGTGIRARRCEQREHDDPREAHGRHGDGLSSPGVGKKMVGAAGDLASLVLVAELTADGSGREHHAVHVHVEGTRILADRLDQLRVDTLDAAARRVRTAERAAE